MKLEILKSMLENASKENPVTRQQLKATFRISDRSGRAMIEDLRKQGVRVCTSLSSGGYWIAKTEAEYQEFRKQYVAYPLEALDTVKKMDKRLDEGQVKMHGIL